MGNKNLENITSYVDIIKSIQETILANIVLVGQIPAPTFHESQRASFFMERLAEAQIDECTVDDFQPQTGWGSCTSATSATILNQWISP